MFLKDLDSLGRPLSDLIIIDNLPKSYSLHPSNGIPIESWYQNPEDEELKKLIPVLTSLSKVKDVRKFIEKFVIKEIVSFRIAEIIFASKLAF